ncbi:MAG: STAS domain-containing protein [Ardenticatenaceae bacterium]|nr:STAS domain-containing protein [Ardenticatenaceae bacterium]HBY93406.1 anti-anti-sigma factor [Chloroflexota bacterium]
MVQVPIIRIGTTLIVTPQEAIHDRAAFDLQNQITAAIERTEARGLILDITALDLVDSFLGRMLNDIAAMARLMGTQTVLVGIQPAVAITLTELGLQLKDIHTAVNVEMALRRLSPRSSDVIYNGL